MNLGSYRLSVAARSVVSGRLGGPFTHWLLNCFGPGRGAAANRWLRESPADDGWRVFRIVGHEGCLHVRAEVPVSSIHQVLYEQAYAWHWHRYEEPETLVGPQDVVFDCGCAEGMFAFLTRSRARRIVGFEPLPEFQEGLHRTFASSANVRIVAAALGAESGTAYLRRCGMASEVTTDITDTRVAVTTIDDYCREHDESMTYLKADLEGFEMQVLRGAADTIRRCRPKIAITTYHVPEHARQIREFLLSIHPDYRIRTKGVEPVAGAPIMLHAW